VAEKGSSQKGRVPTRSDIYSADPRGVSPGGDAAATLDGLWVRPGVREVAVR
jgi:hypothetical protein